MSTTSDREKQRIALIAERAHLQSLADLNLFLATDPKTKDRPEEQARWRAIFQQVLPHLRE